MMIARFELLDVDDGWVEPYARAITSLDDAIRSLITILAAPIAANGSLRIHRGDLALWRWIVEFVPVRPDTPDVLMAMLHTLAQARSKKLGLPEAVIQAWSDVALLALLAEAMVLEVDIPGTAPEVERMLLPPTFTAHTSIGGWEVIPITEAVDCLVVDGCIRHGTTLEYLTDYDTVAMEIAYHNDGADVLDPNHVTVSAEQHTLAIMLDGEVMLHKTYRTDFFITTTKQPTREAKRR
ncbi:hypothetical protein [Ferrimicrobium sp.]|jgi:hypothetical protein|uniref:hypothetical protein n=1 Tax=Ferrimicrobium sp. TaxID=2926050 RepID=UPI002625A0DD|nr:hypothetical protein [Ferrimicrobium sp.]